VTAQPSGEVAPAGSPLPAAPPETAALPGVVTPSTPQPLGQDAIASSGAAGHILIVRAEESTWLSVRADQKDPRKFCCSRGKPRASRRRPAFTSLWATRAG